MSAAQARVYDLLRAHFAAVGSTSCLSEPAQREPSGVDQEFRIRQAADLDIIE